ncbi:peptidase domain-containing ABC transporter [Aetokthonos hydrillicola Thurmond2011]|jgi:ATP-binding cassette subfamily B protein|uniref:Peptidase domain-containing ABC transporter n=1 Tax=Aetokthonos hydrillicola Thurmond2011 TaxID=2712845 RepID=A0AAP5I1K2_9CYAN|nr:peptidase domain-containing ABC transporter [Aetokthonos hydrillicola]MBW4588123.1 peptidase domain-containing ABC transporter [Aetokthonos hydrillicola CCALA 1050]MDR9893437.1 peptidase domain-containing ABC transporter [Aetokthonos hydrillicola Thurmond2011]
MNPFSSLRGQGEQNHTTSQESPTLVATILNLLRLVSLDTNLVSDLSQICVLCEFQLGDTLTSYNPDNDDPFIYLVGQGRIRLLGFDETLGRHVSTQLLLVQHSFGADHLFCDQPLPYQAIAASSGFVAKIPVSGLMGWFQKFPKLKDYLQQLACDRQALIFFKTSTELRSQKSYTLRQLLPYWVQLKITAGSSLVEKTPPRQGHYWLAGGKIRIIADKQPPVVGESWGYPDKTPLDGNAQTDIVVYHLPIEYWDLATAIAPNLFANQPHQLKAEEQELQEGSTKQQETLSYLPSLSENPETPQITTTEPNDLQPTQKSTGLGRGRRIPFIQQQSSSDCGAASLAMISLYWGKRFSLNNLRNLTRTDRRGASLQALADAAQTLGYHALPVRASLDRVELQINPWIAHWQGIHYVVVWRIDGDRVLICDPAIGKRSLSREEFEASWTGYALLLSPTEQLKTLKSDKISVAKLWKTFWNNRNPLAPIILASVLLQVFGLATPLFAQVVLDQVMPHKSFVTLNLFAIGFLIFGLWRIALTGARQYLLDYLATRVDINLVGSFMSHTLRLPLQFFASRQVGDIITRVQENRKIQQFLTRKAVSATLDALMAVVYLELMAYYNLQLTFLMLVLILPVVILTIGASPFLKKVSREIFKESAEQNSSMVEMMAGVATVKTAGVERSVRWRWEERFTNMLKARIRGQKLSNNLHVAISFMHHICSTAVLWYGATLVIRGEMSIGQFVAFNLLIGNAINPVLSLVGLWDEFQEVLISVERLNDVLDAEPEENPQQQLMALPPIRGDVDFENVSFRYHQDQQRNTLQNISFKVKAGQTIGIVGSSGSGKSTLINLLAGLYHPNSGRILIDGYDTTHVSLQSLRSQLSVVPQECFLFSATVLENITLYNSEYTLEQVIAAAKLAQAHSFIQKLPLGYRTQVGERGTMLSGGQRQRIAIARALIRNPHILILDEATSSLDAESEHQFQQNLARLSRVNTGTQKTARTIFIIAHRLSSVRDADCILVLDRGIVVEQGTHNELMAMQGLYYHLVQQQLHL